MSKKSKLLLLLYLSINSALGSEQKSENNPFQLESTYNEIKNWAKSEALLEPTDYNTTLASNEYNISTSSNDEIKKSALEKSIKDIISLVIFNFKKSLNNKIKLNIFEREGYFYFLNKKINTTLDTTLKSINSSRMPSILYNFKELKTIIETFNYFLEKKDNPPTTIKGIENITLNDYYNSLLMMLRPDQNILQPVFRYATLLSQNTVEKKWIALIIHIKNNLLYNVQSFVNKNTSSIKSKAELLSTTIDRIDVNQATDHYKTTYLHIISIYNKYQKLLGIIKNRITHLPELFKNFINWANENNLVQPNQNQKYINENIKDLTYDIRSLMVQKYEDLKNNYMGIITLNNVFSQYNSLSQELKNLEPKEKYEFEDAYNTIVNAYAFYEKITKNSYINWATEQGIFSKEKVENNTLAEIIRYIQNELITKIELLTKKYGDYPPTLAISKNGLPNQTTLSALRKSYTEYNNEKVKIKNVYINWAINNGILIQEDVNNKNLEAIIDLIKDELKKRINNLPKTHENQKKIEALQKELPNLTRLSDLSRHYNEYLTASIKKEEAPIVPNNQKFNQTIPEKKSWADYWRSWLPSWPFKR